jgi:hypothetical protein
VNPGELPTIIFAFTGVVLTGVVIGYFSFKRWQRRDLAIRAAEQERGKKVRIRPPNR